ncbi:MAG: hypothetical protein EXS09_19940 [Gemmataceae bacterium]|nr:hypothetical protein [Gemmataceae bacterium]
MPRPKGDATHSETLTTYTLELVIEAEEGKKLVRLQITPSSFFCVDGENGGIGGIGHMYCRGSPRDARV